MTGTMTFAGLDVHARSTHVAAIDVLTGELRWARFGGGSEEVVGWLRALPQPVYACYEAWPTGFGLYRAAVAAGVRVDVVAPSKTPRPSGDRIKRPQGRGVVGAAAARGADAWVRRAPRRHEGPPRAARASVSPFSGRVLARASELPGGR
jgi:hypothetical protein